MANKNFNTQIRKKFDKGTEEPKSKDMLDRNPNKTMSPETKKRLRDAMERSNKQKEARSKKPTRGKPKDNKTERRTKAIEHNKKPKKNKIKDKLNEVGNMKVKDAAKVVGKAALATTPIGLATNAAKSVKKNFKFQSPIVRKNKKFGGK